MERKTGFEPATTTLARWGSTGLSYFRVRKTAQSAANLPATLRAVKALPRQRLRD